MPTHQRCGVKTGKNEEPCTTQVRHKGKICARHKKALRDAVFKARREKTPDLAELEQRCLEQKQFYGDYFEDPGHCETFACTRPSQKGRNVCAKCAQAQARECLESGCPVRTSHARQYCAKHFAEFQARVAALEKRGRTPNERTRNLIKRHVAIFKKDEEKRNPTCADSTCELTVHYRGQLCAKHRAALKKAHENQVELAGEDSTEAKQLKEAVRKQKEFARRRRSRYYRRKEAASWGRFD